MSIERHFDVPLIAAMALKEKQIQQNYRPIIGVHKWFARRPGTLFRGLILAEFSKDPLARAFFQSNDLAGLRIVDPFMGGGTPLIEANRVGCDVEGFDVNPMSAWIVREEMEQLDLEAYEKAASSLIHALREDIGRHYRTTCPLYGDRDVPVKSFLWVKVLDCAACGTSFDLFPGYLLARNRRHPNSVLICPDCGDLNEVKDLGQPGACGTCRTPLRRVGPARRGRCACPRCGHANAYPGSAGKPPGHRMFAIEYHNPERKRGHKGRFFKKPDPEDIARMSAATRRWKRMSTRFVPDQKIPAGDETRRLHRWGYARYRDMFNPRQLLGLELSCRLVARESEYVKAKRYCEAPFEVRHLGRRKVRVPIERERIGERANGTSRRVTIRCESATEAMLAHNSLDAVFTDPPYFGNVQYAELMDFCYVWLRRLIGKQAEGFGARYCQWASKMSHFRALKMSHCEDRPAEGASDRSGAVPRESPRPHDPASGGGVSGSGSQRMDGLRELGVAPHPVAVAPDVYDVAAVEQPLEKPAAMTSSPRMRPHSSKPLLEVSTVEARP